MSVKEILDIKNREEFDACMSGLVLEMTSDEEPGFEAYASIVHRLGALLRQGLRCGLMNGEEAAELALEVCCASIGSAAPDGTKVTVQLGKWTAEGELRPYGRH